MYEEVSPTVTTKKYTKWNKKLTKLPASDSKSILLLETIANPASVSNSNRNLSVIWLGSLEWQGMIQLFIHQRPENFDIREEAAPCPFDQLQPGTLVGVPTSRLPHRLQIVPILHI